MPEAAQHIIRSYDQDLNQLRGLIVEMGRMVESQLDLATKAVMEGDAAAATRAVEADPAVDELERRTEQFVIRLLALRQPMASDLRLIIGALKASDDLERIGDYAANVAKRSMVLILAPPSFSVAGVGQVAELTRRNLHRMINAIDALDAAAAAEAWRADKAVDDMYNVVVRELMTYMLENPHNISSCAHLLFVARNLERIGDHTTNVAETVYYAITGEELTGPRPKSESNIYTPRDLDSVR